MNSDREGRATQADQARSCYSPEAADALDAVARQMAKWADWHGRHPIGDGDPREYGGILPDGRMWLHPPYGPVEIRRPPPFLRLSAPRRSWWRRLLRRP